MQGWKQKIWIELFFATVKLLFDDFLEKIGSVVRDFLNLEI